MKALEKAVREWSSIKGYAPERFDPFSVDTGIKVYDRNRPRRFYHSGDIGDIIYALPTMRALGGGELVLGPQMRQDVRATVRAAMTEKMAAMLRPLLQLQSYVKWVAFAPAMPEVDVDLNKFREELVVDSAAFRRTGRLLNLAEAHLKRFRLDLRECQKPWLVVDRAVAIKDRPVILHRSPRWRNSDFPWQDVLEKYGSQALFVGLRSEYDDFVSDWGADLPFYQISDFLDMARLIAGSELFIGNQSFPYALAEGMKKTSLLEVWPDGPNCLFQRPNANYGLGKNVYIPNLKFSMVEEKLTECPMCGTADAVPVRRSADIVSCNSCNLVYLRTRMSADSMEEHYQRYADGTSHMRLPERIEEVRTSGLRREYFMQELLEHVKSGALLDIGSGWGAWLSNARAKGFSVRGVEICRKMADFACSVLGVPTMTRQLEDCGFANADFDVVTAIHSLEHLPYPKTAWETVRRILRPGGFFCGIVPNFESLCSRAQKEGWMWLDPNMHYVHYTENTLRQCLERFGFQPIRIYTATGDFDPGQVAKVVSASSQVPIGEEEMKSRIEAVCASGEGEELRWFAQKKS